jgi:hypothetical protein
MHKIARILHKNAGAVNEALGAAAKTLGGHLRGAYHCGGSTTKD